MSFACAVCGQEAPQPMKCSRCRLQVHSWHYGLSASPPSFMCDVCSSGLSNTKCVLCNGSGGPMKKTTAGAWCHVICALGFPESKFGSPGFGGPIDLSGITSQPVSRQCSICLQSKGACIPCAESGCTNYFHASCLPPHRINLDIDRRLVAGYCQKHAPADDETPCQICLDKDTTDEDPIVLCDGCNCSVHRECAGLPESLVKSDYPWYCDACRALRQQAGKAAGGFPTTMFPLSFTEPHMVPCALCPVRTAAPSRPTTDGKWVHLVCVRFMGELWRKDVNDEHSKFINIMPLDRKRVSLNCQVCRKTHVGACIQCSAHGCKEAFHPMCAVKGGLRIEFDENQNRINFYCSYHSRRDHNQLSPKTPGIRRLDSQLRRNLSPKLMKVSNIGSRSPAGPRVINQTAAQSSLVKTTTSQPAPVVTQQLQRPYTGQGTTSHIKQPNPAPVAGQRPAQPPPYIFWTGYITVEGHPYRFCGHLPNPDKYDHHLRFPAPPASLVVEKELTASEVLHELLHPFLTAEFFGRVHLEGRSQGQFDVPTCFSSVVGFQVSFQHRLMFLFDSFFGLTGMNTDAGWYLYIYIIRRRDKSKK